MFVPTITIDRGSLDGVAIDPQTSGGVVFDASGVRYSVAVDEEDFGPSSSLEVELVGGRHVRFAMGEGPFDARKPFGPFPRDANPTVLRLTWRAERNDEPTIVEIPAGASDLDGPQAVIQLGRGTTVVPGDGREE